jgi:hypothetical protein
VLQQPFAQLHDVGLGGAVNALASFSLRECEGELHDLLAPFARDQLETLGDTGRLHVLDASVQVLDVLPDEDDVELPAAEGGLDAGKLAHRADVAEGLEESAERDVGASVSEADRSLERALENDARALDRLNGFFRDSGLYSFLEDRGSGFAALEFNRCTCRFNDAKSGFDDFGSDAISW